MPVLSFLRQYGAREYAVMLAIAAIAGLGIAVLINSASGGAAGAPAVLKIKQAVAQPPTPAPRAFKPVSRARPATHRKARRHPRHVRRSHRLRRVVPAPRPAPVTQTTQEPKVSTPVSSPSPAPAPAPVVRRPAPAPKHAPAPSPKGGGGIQFDDSG